jgi:predicted dinucleotide-binding enzyme
MTSVSILGLGAYARAIGTRAVEGGNAVEVIGRDAAKAKDLAAALGGGTTAGTFGTAPAGDIVILAVPYASAVDGPRSVRRRAGRQGHHRHLQHLHRPRRHRAAHP